MLSMPFVFLFLGILFGSFYNVVGLRVPKKESILYPPSHCPACKKRLRPIELIPILSYLFLRAKCRGCKQSVSPIYPIMEGLTGLAFLLVYTQYGLAWETLLGILFVSLLIIITVSDIAYRLIPDRVLLPFFVLFLILRFLQPYDGSYLSHLISMAAGFTFFLLLAIITRGGVGGGDIKLYAVIGLFLTPSLLMLTVFLSSAFGAVYGLVLYLSRRATGKTMIPFGPFIALGAAVSYLYGSELISWYLSLY